MSNWQVLVVNETTRQPKKTTNPQSGQNSDTCALHIFIPANQLIILRTVRFGRGRRKV